jgi:uncharacterized FAD-dependent dehydrogenase
VTEQYEAIIVGGGPAGIFAAMELVDHGCGKLLILEKGKDLAERQCVSKERQIACAKCHPCGIVCGWGGAGAFSDGKLTLSTEVGGFLDEYVPKEELNRLIRKVDDSYLRFGASTEIFGADEEALARIEKQALLAELRFIPSRIRHLGSGRSQIVLKAMKDFLTEKGVTIRLGEEVAEILIQDAAVTGVSTGQGRTYLGKHVIVCPGREGSEWLVREGRRLKLDSSVNPVDIGVRVELPAEVLEKLTGIIFEGKFIYYSKTFEDRVRTFCMCPHGEVVMENNDGLITVNGHSHAERKTVNTNFALLVSKFFTHPFKKPITYGRYIAGLANLLGGGVIVQRLGDLQSGRRTTAERLAKGLVCPTLTEATPGDLSLVLPYRHLTALMEMLRALDQIAPGINSRNTLLYGVEVKFYSARLSLNNSLETKIRNLYAAGDGAGVTRGLMQASISGIIAARDISRKLR